MRWAKQTCELLEQLPGLDGIYKQIEYAGRTCYQSFNKMTATSAKKFVKQLIKSGHTAMLEHGTIYLKCLWDDYEKLGCYKHNPYSRVVMCAGVVYITTNLRVLVENKWIKDLRYLCEPTDHHEKRCTMVCDTALHCYKDLTRHRTMSFAISSTRYCNYSNTKKFGEMRFIKPTWYDKSSRITRFVFKTYLKLTERTYNFLIKKGWQVQQAAEVLPQCIHGQMVITGFESDWRHLLNLRYFGNTGAPHPMVKNLAKMMYYEFEMRNYASNN